MVKLRADEHRYLVTASGREEALVRQIPGARFVAGIGALQLARQPGVIIALDRILGANGWEHSSDLAQEVIETRNRITPPPQQRATVSLVGGELAVECAFGDKELVKLVPGYRWSAPQRMWFLPASPMALDLLSEHFSSLLEVDESARKFLDLKRIDEQAALERVLPISPAAINIEVVEPFAATQVKPVSDAAIDAGEAPLLERLDRLAGAVEALVEILQQAQIGPKSAVAVPLGEESPAPPLAESAKEGLPPDSWRLLLAEADADPTAALQRVSARLQLAGQEELPALRAVAGIASSLAGEHREALSYLRKAQESSAIAVEADLQQRLSLAYVDSVLALISAATSPVRPVAALNGLEELVLAELVHDSGFSDDGLGSKEARDLLSLLMDDQHLRRRAPVLADYCRVLHLVCVARGGRWMAADRVVEMLRHRDLTDDGFALGVIVLANTIFEQPCMDEWLLSWPPESNELGFDDLRRVTSDANARLIQVDPTLGAQAALAVLALISGANVEVASMEERRELVRLVPPRAAERRYAEFLAGFQLAQAGMRKVTQNFPGYLQILANYPLAQSAPHILTVFVNDSGGTESTTRRIAEDVYLSAFSARGVRDPQSEVLDLVDMLAESPKADNLLNELSQKVEDEEFPGTNVFSHESRTELYGRAFQIALRAGHNHDSVVAFDRCVREFLSHGEFDALRTFCLGVPTGFKPLQLPVGQALLSLQLESGEDFEPAAELVLRNCNPKSPDDEGTLELRGLGLMFPKFREYLSAHLPAGEVASGDSDPDFSGRRILVVGGHEWLRKHAMPTFDRWGVKTTWLGPDAAKNGSQATDLAAGENDLIVINTACISHAASIRVRAAAEKADAAGRVKVAYHNSRGLGALMSIAREALADTQPPLTPPKPTRANERRKLLR
ncbi:MAG: hypothetical protein ABI577_04500 [bacterium]